MKDEKWYEKINSYTDLIKAVKEGELPTHSKADEWAFAPLT